MIKIKYIKAGVTSMDIPYIRLQDATCYKYMKTHRHGLLVITNFT